MLVNWWPHAHSCGDLESLDSRARLQTWELTSLRNRFGLADTQAEQRLEIPTFPLDRLWRDRAKPPPAAGDLRQPLARVVGG